MTATGGTTELPPGSGGEPSWIPPDCMNIEFADQLIEDTVRRIAQKPTGPLTAADVSRVERLNLGLSQVTSLEGVECLSALEQVDMTGTFESLEPLRGLSKLMYLYVNSTQLKNVDAVSSLVSLKKLHFWNVPATDLAAVSGLPALVEVVILVGSGFIDFAPLCENPALSYLRIENTQLADLTQLDGCTHVPSMSLTKGLITDITPLSKHTQLVELDLSNNQISDISPLSGLSNLTSLGLSSNTISDFSPLGSLTTLQSVGVSYNPSISLDPLISLSALTQLHAFGAGLDCNSEQANIAVLEDKLDRNFQHDCP